MLLLCSCGGTAGAVSGDSDSMGEDFQSGTTPVSAFNSDSAYSYLVRQVEFGPRVPNSEAHRLTGEWLVSELTRHGAQVVTQRADLKAFDGTVLKSVNIMGRFAPDNPERLLLLAHYDTRPWADEDENEENHTKAIDGANDGASGVAILLETARRLGQLKSAPGIDILFVDSEDYGTDGDEDSWALGTQYFTTHPIVPGYMPAKAILLDMVGAKGAVFPAEYFSRRAAPALDDDFRSAAERAGHGNLFPKIMGGAVTDDHVKLIEQGIPAIDIIDYRVNDGFCPTWHTMADNLDNIDKNTLRAVGETLYEYLRINQEYK